MKKNNLTEVPFRKDLKIIKDNRGFFAELIRNTEIGQKEFGQISLTVANKNEVKGGHYHKKGYEWFIVLKGKITFLLVHEKTNEKVKFVISSRKLQSLCIPPFWTHTLVNNAKSASEIILYSTLAYNPKRPDVFPSDKR